MCTTRRQVPACASTNQRPAKGDLILLWPLPVQRPKLLHAILVMSRGRYLSCSLFTRKRFGKPLNPLVCVICWPLFDHFFVSNFRGSVCTKSGHFKPFTTLFFSSRKHENFKPLPVQRSTLSWERHEVHQIVFFNRLNVHHKSPDFGECQCKSRA